MAFDVFAAFPTGTVEFPEPAFQFVDALLYATEIFFGYKVLLLSCETGCNQIVGFNGFILFLLYLFTNDLSNFAIDWGVFGVIMIPSGAFGLMNIYFNFISLKQSGK